VRRPGASSREWFIRLSLLAGSLTFSLGAAEVVARVFFPIYGGVDNVTMEGAPVREWFAPGSVYRQVSNEYDARTTITRAGHRVPGTDGSPDVIFLGDSFTFGFGLTDEETFASIYCGKLGVTCANLGIPGSGTSRQIRRLEQFLTQHGWRPREVKLFYFGMSNSFSSGNDFVDNYNYGRNQQSHTGAEPPPPASAPSLSARIIGMQSTLMEHSYLVRRAKYHWGPMLKSMIVDPPGDRMPEALRYSRQALAELDDMSRKYNFDYKVYLIVPVHDILRGTDDETLTALNSVSPKPAITTAPALKDNPSRYYYSFDGHLNPEGSRRVADLLVAQDQPLGRR
jgi:hypothetical protein